MTNLPEEIPVTENRINKMVGSCVDIAEYFGNGDRENGEILLARLVGRIIKARKKNPLFARDKQDAKRVIMDEAEELCLAIDCESRNRQIDETLDVMATCVRFLNNEHLPEICEK